MVSQLWLYFPAGVIPALGLFFKHLFSLHQILCFCTGSSETLTCTHETSPKTPFSCEWPLVFYTYSFYRQIIHMSVILRLLIFQYCSMWWINFHSNLWNILPSVQLIKHLYIHHTAAEIIPVIHKCLIWEENRSQHQQKQQQQQQTYWLFKSLDSLSFKLWMAVSWLTKICGTNPYGPVCFRFMLVLNPISRKKDVEDMKNQKVASDLMFNLTIQKHGGRHFRVTWYVVESTKN